MTMLNSVFAKAVWERRRSVFYWISGILVLAALTIGFYPIVRDESSLQDIDYPEALLALFGIEEGTDLFSGSGFVESQLYANWVPILLLIFTIGMGMRAMAGEEDKGTMDLLLAHPVSRTRIVLDNFLAICFFSVVFSGLMLVILLIGNYAVDFEFHASGIVSLNLCLALISVLFGTLALAIGGLTGKRGATLGITAAVAVFMFFLFGLAPLVEATDPLKRLSPFYWFLGPNHLDEGFAWWPLPLFVVSIGGLLALAVRAFQRRDVYT
jgi:ABC-2 type transport system permease protein